MKNLTPTTEGETELPALQDENDLKWEQNHAKITSAILQHVRQYGTMPAKATIATVTKLSRDTVYKHLRSFTEHANYQTGVDSLNIMSQQVMAQVLRAAMEGDLQAAKLFLETTKPLNAAKENTRQSNYIQINKTVINQQVIQQLKPEQLNRIEEIIAKELHEK